MTSADSTYRAGLEAEERLDYQSAQEHFARAVEVDPANVAYLEATARNQCRLGHYDEAATLQRTVLEVLQAKLGPEHPDLAVTLITLADLCQDEDSEEALALYMRALVIQEKALGLAHEKVDDTLKRIGGIHYVMERDDIAESLYRQYLTAREQAFGAGHLSVARIRFELGSMYRAVGREAKARAMLAQARPVLSRALEAGGLIMADWSDVGLPWFADLLGEGMTHEGFARLCLQYLLSTDSPYESTSCWYENAQYGVSVDVSHNRISAIQFFSQEEQNFGGPLTPAFLGVHYGMSRKAVRAMLGEPGQVVGRRDLGAIRYAGIDRYYLPVFSVALTYALQTGGLEVISFEEFAMRL